MFLSGRPVLSERLDDELLRLARTEAKLESLARRSRTHGDRCVRDGSPPVAMLWLRRVRDAHPPLRPELHEIEPRRALSLVGASAPDLVAIG